MKKMNALLLGGNTKNNVSWIKKTKKAFSKDYEIREMYYDHWKIDGEINFDVELGKLKELSDSTEDYYIISKSIGSIISMMGINKGFVKPKAIIILGFPLKYVQRVNMDIMQMIEDAIKKTEILVIQQKNDPLGGFDEISCELPNSIKVVEIPGNYHIYGNINLIKPIVDNFFKSQENEFML